MIEVLPPVVVQKLGVVAAARAFATGVRQGRTFSRTYATSGAIGALGAASRARRVARAGVASQAGVRFGARASAVRARMRSDFAEGVSRSRGVSNRMVLRAALSRRVPVPLSMRAGFLASAARGRTIRVRDPGVRGGSYLRRVSA